MFGVVKWKPRPFDQDRDVPESEKYMARHPSTESIMKWFDTSHLPDHLRAISDPCAHLATEMVNAIPVDSPELTTGLRKLLEAKDCFVRTAIEAHDTEQKDPF